MFHIHVSFTGTRNGMTRRQKIGVRGLLRASDIFHHGDCDGSDEEAHDIALDIGCDIEIHPPEDSKLRAFCKGAKKVHPVKPYLVRNKDMVRVCNVLIATPEGPEIERSGTWSTIRYADKRKCHVIIIYPNGDVEHRNKGSVQ